MKKTLLTLFCALISVFAANAQNEHENDLRLTLTGGSLGTFAEGDSNGEMTVTNVVTDADGNPISATYTITNGTWGNNAGHLGLFKHKLTPERMKGYKGVVIEFEEEVPASNGDATYGFIPVGFVCPSIGWHTIKNVTEYGFDFSDEKKSKGIDDFSVFFNASGDLKDATITIKGVWMIREEVPTLSKNMFCEWDGYGKDATVVSEGVGAYEFQVSTGLPYGDVSVNGKNYADLSEYEILALTVEEGAPRLLLNRQSMDGSGEFIEINNAGSPYVAVIESVWYINLKKIVREEGYAHLNCIKGANWANVTITQALLLKEDVDGIFKTLFDFSETAANTTTFDLSMASNYDMEAGKFTANGGWTFETPQDLSTHKWLVVTTTYNASKAGGAFRIADADGHSIGGEDYNKGGNTSRGSMWIDRWNNQICATVNMEYLANNGIDITKIKSLTFSANHPVSAVYMTNYDAGQAVACTWSWGNCQGDHVREYSKLPEGKFGTVALARAAAVSGAYIYTVDSFDPAWGISLSRHYGIMEAGVPYFYAAIDEVGLNGDKEAGGDNYNVNFFYVDNEKVNTTFTDENVGNGLVGCLGKGLENIHGRYILTNNKLRKIGADANGVTIAKNRCFFDPEKYKGPQGGTSDVRIAIMDVDDEATGIDSVVEKALNSDRIYDLSGREVKEMKKGGTYIMGGIKVHIK